MREIEFRGKRLDNGEWTYGTGIVQVEENTYDTNKYEIVQKVNYDELDYFMPSYETKEVNPKTIGQYTGLKDKNGKKIFGGDIVKVFINGKWWIAKVIYEYSGFTIDITNNKELEFGRKGIIERFTEVIGNIHDNPELLEAENE